MKILNDSKNAMLTTLFVIGLLITTVTLNTNNLIAEPGATQITCYSVLETCIQCRYNAVECSTCTSKKCDNYTSSGSCTPSNSSNGGGSIN